ncbi:MULTISPECIES: type II toxin-antitoxin system Phd/YefM family antitoxin [Thermotoga]|jgi:prevent-host-death family protein|uniref:Antitoxin n=3 Tax=Thermotoga TaxID=2335 RepID=A5IMT1_THEP1|nr:MULTISPECIES: type II toxin-antitoxin system Phd/YefM family antitoxin [Thermotoga]KUK22764.1 MAG: Prevent-host-death family protein [Thermotoga petrophila]KUK34033.1 MAG: Prevent-host-death family protein [Thermotoga sp. 47_83]MBZ4661443.1 Prevent-host-death family protein [Thermotoga sp.]ABQ47504.1 prevent-host-death family protein [Thermotoga petrophila RKU-1]ACB09880.1 prevent-host-death family protein [Thermotoga sp. RQ2]
MDLSRVSFYSLADAKARFSQVVEEAKTKDVVVTKNGVPAVAVIDYEKYRKLMEFMDEILDTYLLDIGNVEKYLELKKYFEFNDSQEV